MFVVGSFLHVMKPGLLNHCVVRQMLRKTQFSTQFKVALLNRLIKIKLFSCNLSDIFV